MNILPEAKNPTCTVLDHGIVSLVNKSGTLNSVLDAARVSYGTNNKTGEDEVKDEKLLHYLLANKHTSPFEHVSFTFYIKAPIFIFRQWHRHRTWSYNEVSARYTELPEEYYVPELELITTQHTDNKQMRTTTQHPQAAYLSDLIKEANYESFQTYKGLIAEGCPRELARSVLPVGTYSSMYATVDLHNLMHFLRLRLHEHAQYEIREYAKAIIECIAQIDKPMANLIAQYTDTL